MATFSARTFAQSTGISPPTESSNLEDNAFAVLMKKPLTKSVIKNEDVEEKPIDDDTKVLSQHGELKIPPKSTFFLPRPKINIFENYFENGESERQMN